MSIERQTTTTYYAPTRGRRYFSKAARYELGIARRAIRQLGRAAVAQQEQHQ